MLGFLRRSLSPGAPEPLGALGERLGCQYLRQKGYRILETNFKNPTGRRLGEIDIIAQFRKKLVFIEVKTRAVRNDLVLPEESIGPHKLHRLAKIAAYYLRLRGKEGCDHAFDALSIQYDPVKRRAKIRHLESIFL